MKQEIFFTSDTHFGHAKLVQYYKHPFKSVEEHDEHLIDRWNATVPSNGIVYHLGDFAFAHKDYVHQIRQRLNGQVFLVRGNHDKRISKKTFGWVKDYYEARIPDETLLKGRAKIILSHYPMLSFQHQHKGAWHLFGHSHSNANQWIDKHLPEARMLDIGVENHNYTPVSYHDVKDYMLDKRGHFVDHHNED